MRSLIICLCLCLASPLALADRLKDIASIAGVRSNQLIGYGLVVGRDGSGDQTTQTPFTVQSIINMLGNMGVTMPPGTNLQLKNVAAVMVTADLPPNSYIGPSGFQGLRGAPGSNPRSAQARDADAARRLWEVSEQRTGTAFPL